MYGLSLHKPDDEDELSGESGWIPWFCGIKGHELIVEVEEKFIRDNFNLYGLRQRFQFYDHALDMILSNAAPDEEDLADADFLEMYRHATHLYGLIHSRFIVSPQGLQVMREMYLKGVFGTCPRVLCKRQHVLPIGTSDEFRAAQVKMFCPLCEQVYSPKSKYRELDGAYFGTSFPHVFLQSYPSLVPLEPPTPFTPRVHGFKLHKMKSLIARKLEDEQGISWQSTGTAVRREEKHPGTKESKDEQGISWQSTGTAVRREEKHPGTNESKEVQDANQMEVA